MPKYSNCKSCGIPMIVESEVSEYSLENSSESHFCSLCYQEGDFQIPEIYLQAMKESKRKFSTTLNKMVSRNIQKLARWNTSP
ncbi:zinc ribbon domain-containing protein [Membranihabitans maritimus]|uniref:zinc ribbon domain-containing protein n=1 Tax=Membranihabitans maritimus TaxID=2904244 RepID=UPI001F379EE7|nr:zinc ribbon domain-containing protein [Membranihabitans maritimus]